MNKNEIHKELLASCGPVDEIWFNSMYREFEDGLQAVKRMGILPFDGNRLNEYPYVLVDSNGVYVVEEQKGMSYLPFIKESSPELQRMVVLRAIGCVSKNCSNLMVEQPIRVCFNNGDRKREILAGEEMQVRQTNVTTYSL